MSSLDRLIRARQWQLDEQRRNLRELERLAERLQAELAQFGNEPASDGEESSREPENLTLGDLGDDDVRTRRGRLLRSLGEINSELARAAENVDAAYAEFKKLDDLRIRNKKRDILRRKQTSANAEGRPRNEAIQRASGNKRF